MSEIIEVEIVQGDTGPMWLIGVPNLDANGLADGDADLTAYTCTLKFAKTDGSDYERAVTSKNTAVDRFLAQLTSEETDFDFMAVGKSRIVFEVKNSEAPPYVSEVQIDVKVISQRRGS